MDLFKNTAAVTIFGNTKWKQRPREEQAEADSMEELEKVSALFGIEKDDLVKGLLKPRIKVKNFAFNVSDKNKFHHLISILRSVTSTSTKVKIKLK